MKFLGSFSARTDGFRDLLEPPTVLADDLKAYFEDGVVWICPGATVGDWRHRQEDIKEKQKKED